MIKLLDNRYRLNRLFLGLYRWLFLAFAGTVTSGFIVALAFRDFLQFASVFITSVWLLMFFLLGSFVLHLTFAFPLRVRVYYYLWLDKVVPALEAAARRYPAGPRKWLVTTLLGDVTANTHRVISSFKEQQDADVDDPTGVWRRNLPVPVFIRREDLMAKRFWPDWAFAIIILFNTIRVTRQRVGGATYLTLHVDLRDQSYGIYSNAGKRFLREEWGAKENFATNCLSRSESIERFLSSPERERLEVDCEQLPLRWASGGFIPIVHWRERTWVALFFRDLNPIGWNVANGASEAKEEYKDLNLLTAREFGEELLVLNCRPDRNCHYLPFDFPDTDMNRLVKKFSEQHITIRAEHDDLYMEKSTQVTKVRFMNTPFRLRVKYHSKTFETKQREFRNILFSVNPCEFGVEILRVAEFSLPEEGYLLDGEILNRNTGSMLVRRPIVMYDIERLRRLVRENKDSLGRKHREMPHLECKTLGERIEPEHYRLFGVDLKFRTERLAKLGEEKGKRTSFEVRRLRAWSKRFGDQFKDAQQRRALDPQRHADLLCFCPVTWKALEAIFEHEIL